MLYCNRLGGEFVVSLQGIIVIMVTIIYNGEEITEEKGYRLSRQSNV